MATDRAKTRYVVLGLLCAGPGTGYTLKAAIERAIGHFWRESYGQLYPTLNQLADEGLAEKVSKPSGGRPRYEYSITDAGREALAAWLLEPPSEVPVRDELMLKVFFGRYGALPTLREHLQASLRRFEATAQQLSMAQAWLRKEQADAPDLPFWLLSADRGARVAEARAQWARHAIEVIENLEAQSP